MNIETPKLNVCFFLRCPQWAPRWAEHHRAFCRASSQDVSLLTLRCPLGITAACVNRWATICTYADTTYQRGAERRMLDLWGFTHTSPRLSPMAPQLVPLPVTVPAATALGPPRTAKVGSSTFRFISLHSLGDWLDTLWQRILLQRINLMQCNFPLCMCSAGQSGFPVFIKQTKGLNSIKGSRYLSFNKNIFHICHSFLRLT